MRIRAVLPYLFLVEVLPVRAQPCWSAGPVAPDRTYTLMPSDEDWSFLRDPALRQDFWDPTSTYAYGTIATTGTSALEARFVKTGRGSGTTTGASNLSRTPSFFKDICGALRC